MFDDLFFNHIIDIKAKKRKKKKKGDHKKVITFTYNNTIGH